MKYKVTFKESHRKERIAYCSSNWTEKEIIECYGLFDPEIEYYKIEKVEEEL